MKTSKSESAFRDSRKVSLQADFMGVFKDTFMADASGYP